MLAAVSTTQHGRREVWRKDAAILPADSLLPLNPCPLLLLSDIQLSERKNKMTVEFGFITLVLLNVSLVMH